MEGKVAIVESLLDRTEAFAKTSVDLFKLKALDKTADVASLVVSRVVVAIVIAILSVLLNIGIALWIGDALGKSYYGFFIVAAFYVLVWIILALFKDALLENPVRNAIIRKAFK
jgi:hypothetical protein